MLTFFFLSVFLKMLLYCLYFCFLYLAHLIALAALESFFFFYGFKQFNSNVLGVCVCFFFFPIPCALVMREMNRKNPGIWKGFLSGSQQSSDMSMFVEKCPRRKKETLEKIMGQCLVFTRYRQLYLSPWISGFIILIKIRILSVFFLQKSLSSVQELQTLPC